jgi:membrane fusion protein (multidrug efflux system)
MSVVPFVLFGCHKEGDSAKEAKPTASIPPPSVLIAEVIQQTVPLYQEFTARTDASSTVDLRARVEGILQEQLFEEGKLVKKDQVLYKIDPLPFEATLLSAQAKHEKAIADLDFANKQVTVLQAEAELAQANARLVREVKELERTTALTKQGVQTPADLDTQTAREKASRAEAESREAQLTNAKLSSDANIKQASAAVEIARADVTQAELNLGYCTIKAPFDGLISLVEVDPGNLVGRGEPTLLATVSALDPIRVSMAMSEADYLHFVKNREEGRKPPEFEMVLADGKIYPHKGQFLMADLAVDLKTGTLTFVAAFPNPKNDIRPGQFARVKTTVEEIENALLVSQKAVFEMQSAQVVYVVDAENKVVLRTVQPGSRFGDMLIIQDGLKVGEKVIVEGQLKVKPGSIVSPTDKPVSSEPVQAETKPTEQEKGH